MKLNEKGKVKLRNLCNTLLWVIKTGDPVKHFNLAVESFDFEADDFKDCIVLSVEEAKAIAFDLKFLKSFVQFCPSEVKERIAQFESRIEQSEGGKNDNAS